MGRNWHRTLHVYNKATDDNFMSLSSAERWVENHSNNRQPIFFPAAASCELDVLPAARCAKLCCCQLKFMFPVASVQADMKAAEKRRRSIDRTYRGYTMRLQ